MTALAVVGTGLVTPLACTPAEHALFVRAEVGPAAPGAFVDAGGEPIPVAYCSWLGAHGTAGERLAALAKIALDDALRPLHAREREATARAKVPVAVLAISSAPRTGLDAAARSALEAALAPAGADRGVRRLTGAAGFFEGLALAESLLDRGEVRVVVIVAADSYVTPTYLAEHRQVAASAWDAALPLPSEGAAAVLLTTREFAREAGLDVLATIGNAATRRGEASDENDVAVDGADMAALLRRLPDAYRPIGSSFGSHGIGALREREWNLAAPRAVAALDMSCACLALESAVGSLGAAAGAANLVYGVAVHRCGAWPVEYGLRAEAPFLAWAVSPDGTRGLAALRAHRARGRATEAHGATWDEPRVLRPREVPANDAWTDLVIPAQSDASPRGQDDRELDAAAGRDSAHVAIDAERAAPVPLRDHDAAVVAGCLERIALLSRHRDERPWRERSGIEARLLAQVDAIIEARVSVPDLLAFWNEEADEDSRVTWAVVFMLGSLGGRVSLDGVANLVERLPDDAEEHASLVAEALVVVPHPDRASLGHELRRSALPLARAVAVELLSRLGQLGAEAALDALDDEHAAVKAVALRALARLPKHDAATPKIRACLGRGDPAVAWEAARALTLFGIPDAYLDMREAGPLSKVLGPRAVELLVLVGGLDDVAAMERIVRRLPLSAETLSAVGRFGHPFAWPYLVHGLTRPEIADDAQRALVTLFGPLVDAEQEEAAAAWRETLMGAEIPAGTRWRRGKPWSADVVLGECAGGELSRNEIELRQDELRARTGRLAPVDLAAWGSLATLSRG